MLKKYELVSFLRAFEGEFYFKGIMRPSETECRDHLAVTEGPEVLYSGCGDSKKPIILTSSKNTLNITLHSSVNIYSKRGFMAYFKGK